MFSLTGTKHQVPFQKNCNYMFLIDFQHSFPTRWVCTSSPRVGGSLCLQQHSSFSCLLFCLAWGWWCILLTQNDLELWLVIIIIRAKNHTFLTRNTPKIDQHDILSYLTIKSEFVCGININDWLSFKGEFFYHDFSGPRHLEIRKRKANVCVGGTEWY